ncbi:MAG: hypothetical protein BWY94_02175 [Actinobacteria bacterium ADurb.BinA094]|nr:MAG: hypothetical protein BWY94_02175 [Actinobacteria bacterium ADurb.BinA094]
MLRAAIEDPDTVAGARPAEDEDAGVQAGDENDDEQETREQTADVAHGHLPVGRVATGGTLQCMETDIVITVLAGLLLVVAAVGVVYPVLPGSPIAIITLVAWAAVVGSWSAWAAGVAGALICVAGWSASAVLTGRKLKEFDVPRWSILIALVAGIAGMFLIPVVGIFVGFAVGLLVSEWIRHGEARTAFHHSLETLKAMGTGMLVEFLLLCVAAAVWSAGVLVHFGTG